MCVCLYIYTCHGADGGSTSEEKHGSDQDIGEEAK